MELSLHPKAPLERNDTFASEPKTAIACNYPYPKDEQARVQSLKHQTLLALREESDFAA
jgi:hypothetical protein